MSTEKTLQDALDRALNPQNYWPQNGVNAELVAFGFLIGAVKHCMPDIINNERIATATVATLAKGGINNVAK